MGWGRDGWRGGEEDRITSTILPEKVLDSYLNNILELRVDKGD